MDHIKVPTPLAKARHINGYSGEAQDLKLEVHKQGKKLLKQLADALELSPGQYEIRSNMAGPAVSGEVTLHADHLYVWMQESCMSAGITMIYRSCSSRKDYCGDRNHSVQLARFAEAGTQQSVILEMKRLVARKREELEPSRQRQLEPAATLVSRCQVATA